MTYLFNIIFCGDMLYIKHTLIDLFPYFLMLRTTVNTFQYKKGFDHTTKNDYIHYLKYFMVWYWYQCNWFLDVLKLMRQPRSGEW